MQILLPNFVSLLLDHQAWNLQYLQMVMGVQSEGKGDNCSQIKSGKISKASGKLLDVLGQFA